MSQRKLQYQLSNGSWMDCDSRTEEFLLRCEKFSGLDRESVLAALESGKKLRNDSEDWYSNCRYEPLPRKSVEMEMVKCDCGCLVPDGSVMHASMGTSCPDCYDRMSC